MDKRLEQRIKEMHWSGKKMVYIARELGITKLEVHNVVFSEIKDNHK